MDRFLTHPVCELCGKASGRARFAARRGRGMKDHGRAQETVVIGAMRPLVIDLRRLLLLDAGRRRGAALLSGADRCGRLPGVRIAGLAVSLRCYASSREAQHCAALRFASGARHG